MLLVPSFLILILACPALLTQSGSQNLRTGGQRGPRDTKPEDGRHPIKVISETCFQGDTSDSGPTQGKELNLEPGSPLVLTHRIRLIPGSCGGGCEAEFASLRDRVERLEKEVSALREKCGGAEGGCCTSQQSKGAGCTIKPETDDCPNECSDQGRCEDGKCLCFPGFRGPDCSLSDCPGNCNDKGKCVNGQCVCDPGFTGPDCSSVSCPSNCNNKGQCVDGQCVCNQGFTGPDCSSVSCPGNCNNKGRCVDGQCVCNPGFTGPDCSSVSCPGNCNNKGRCVDGQCVCNPGFTGTDCSSVSCPGNCNNKGRCVDGQCVCNPGFTGPDCSSVSCPGNCNNKGRCVDGQCVCNPGFTGPDCSTKACPGNCKNRGKCVKGKCVCDSGFTGPDCSTKPCPGNCSNRGKCVNGQCVCDSGFTGPDCSAKACPNNCSNKGKCVNGKCVCEVGFTGQDCATKSCPNNCSNKGRCVKGRCVCQRGFAAPDCKQCESGFTGADCGTAMSGVSQLRTKDITESSVTLFWTPPPVQYDTYHLTFVSQKEGDQQITSQVGGKLTTYTQTGLAAGQEYTVTVKGEIDGKLGANSTAEFTTLISGPTNLRVVKTTTTSAVVQWEQSQGDIDRYRLSVEPHQKDGNAKGRQELTLPPERDSAQIDGLDPGRLYDITLVAEKGKIKSKPATVQVTPGKSTKTISRKAIETATSHIATGVRIHKGQAEGNTKPMRVNKKTTGEGPEMTKTIQGPGSGTVYGTNRTKENPSNSTSTRLLVNKKEKVVPKINGKITLNRRPQIGDSIRFNGTRVIQGVRRVGQSLLQKPASRNPILGIKKTVDDESKPKNPIAGDKTKAITVKDTKLEINLRGENSGPLTKTHPAVILPEIPHIKDLSDTKHGRETEINGPGPGREGLEHTITGHRYPTASSPSLESPASNKPQPTSAPPKPDQSKAGKALSVSPARFSTLPPDAQPKRPPVSSSESEQSGKGDHSASVNSEELHSTKDGAAVIVDGHDTYRDIIGGRVRSSTEQNKTLTVGGTSPVRQLPPKLTRLPRPYPNMGPFQNRTRSYPRPPQHLSRGPVRSPLPPKQINRGDNSIIIQTTQPGGKGTYSTTQNETSTDLTPKDLLQRKNATATAQGYTHRRSEDSSRQMGHNSKTGHHDFGSLVDTTAVSRGSPNQINGSDVPTTITNGQPLISVGVRSLTSGGFILIWGAPEGMYKNFIVTREEQGSKKEAKKGNEEEGEAQTDKEIKGNKEVSEREVSQGKNGGEEKSVSNRRNDHNGQRSNSNTTAKVERRILKFSKVLPGSARSFPFKDLQPQTHYSLSVFGKGPGIRSKIHRLIVRTGPEPPSGLLFSDVTDTSLYVSWTKPKSPVSGFKVTYTNTMEGEPVSVLVDPGDSTLPLSKLTPGSSYEVSVISILGQDESDTIKDLVVTLPDPPTDLRAINVTDTKALLLWRPALATVDRYVVFYGSEKGSDERMITVSGNAAEQQLKELQPSTTYTVRVTSQLGSRDSSPATAVFTTTRGSDGDVLRDLEASQVTARSALLTWKAPSAAVGSYRLSYQTVGQEIQEVTVDSTETEFMLTRLHPLSKYTVQLQGERGGSHTAALSTEFTTGNLRYPFPSDCSQELLNGIRESGEVEIFPKGKQGKPLLVYCDQETDGGGWTVFQRRMNGKTDFFRGWKNYSRGFGELSGEFWLGNENLHDLTSVAPMTLRVDLRVGDESVFAKYSTFSVDTFRRNYALKVSGYSGTAGDSMSYHNGRPFSTKDRDPMPFITRCAMSYRGGWWYKNCHEANLNGLYNTNVHHQGVIWTTWKGKDFSIPSTEMKFRPASFTPPVQG